MPASVNLPMSAGTPYSSSKARRHDAAPAPPVSITLPSMSNRIELQVGPTGPTTLIHSGTRRQAGRPAFLQPAKPPDQERDHPSRDEHRDDHQPEQVDVDVFEPVPE